MAQILPTAVDDERMILGILLTQDQAMHDVRGVLEAADFAIERHRAVWESCCRLYDDGRPIDRITVWGELDRAGQGDAAGGIGSFVSLDDGMPQTPHLSAYVRRVKDQTARRRIILRCQDVTQRAQQGTESIVSLQQALSMPDVVGDAMQAGLRSTGEILGQHGATALLKPRKDRGLQFPWPWLNRWTYGMLPAELWVLAGHTSTGKTSAMLQHAVNSARHGAPTAIFSLEVGEISLWQKAMCLVARIDSERFKAGELDADELKRQAWAVSELAEMPLYIDVGSTTAMAISASARRLQGKRKLAQVIVDYLQLLGNTARYGTRAEAVGANAWAMKTLATDLQVPVLLLSQFSRASAKIDPKTGKRRPPELGDLKESGDIENHANGVWFIHRETDEDADQVSVQFMLPKQRDGRRNILTDMWFMPPHQRFEEKCDDR